MPFPANVSRADRRACQFDSRTKTIGQPLADGGSVGLARRPRRRGAAANPLGGCSVGRCDGAASDGCEAPERLRGRPRPASNPAVGRRQTL